MPQAEAKIRLHVDAPLGSEMVVPLSKEQAHYLFGVMRRVIGDWVLVFNGRDGEWLTQVAEAGKRRGLLTCLSQTRPQAAGPDLWLCFAPIKKARTDFIAEKACEMGCSRLMPVFTQHTNSERVRTDRLHAHAVEAAEQCGLMSIPGIAGPCTLDKLLSDWPEERALMFCDESGEGTAATDTLRSAGPGPWAVLIGPEGGFSEAEATRLRALPFAHAVSLGPRILRADTAAIAAMTLWQSVLGDWN